ncbi:MAG: response regulator [Myxococcota bacterium]|nr:response regulator [Myxococcota bacterium]
MTCAPILIVDDDRDVRESLRDTLSDDGYATLEATDGGDALALLRRPTTRVSLILLDWNMAPVDAPAFMAELLRDATLCQLPVVLLTADSRISGKGQLAGYVACLKKPVALERLFELVKRYCG